MASVIDGYLSGVETGKRRELERIRGIALAAVPDAEEAIVHQMPTLTFRGVAFLGFAARAKHIGIYPYSGAVVEALREELRGYATSRGAIRVPLDQPIPETLLRAIISCRMGLLVNLIAP